MKKDYLERLISSIKKGKTIKIDPQKLSSSLYSDLSQIKDFKEVKPFIMMKGRDFLFFIASSILVFLIILITRGNVPFIMIPLLHIHSFCFLLLMTNFFFYLCNGRKIKRKISNVKYLLDLCRSLNKDIDELKKNLPEKIIELIKEKKENTLEEPIFFLLNINKEEFKSLEKDFNLSDFTLNSYLKKSKSSLSLSDLEEDSSESLTCQRIPSLFNLTLMLIKENISKKRIQKGPRI